MTRRHLPADARRPCTCVHRGPVRVLTHPACRVHGHGGPWKVTPEALILDEACKRLAGAIS